MMRKRHWASMAVLTLATAATANATTWYVDSTAPPGGQAGTQTNPYVSIQQAVAVASSGDVILVGGGTTPAKVYRPTSQATSIELADQVRIEGGYPGWNEFTLTFDTAPRDPDTYKTILSGDFGGGVHALQVVKVPIGTRPPQNVPVTQAVNLDGFEISGGRGNEFYSGGGIYIEGEFETTTAPVIRDCIIRDNSADYGGGVYADQYTQPTFRGCRFEENSADVSGGGFSGSTDASATFLHCTFESNQAVYEGGAIGTNRAPQLSVVSCEFTNNKVTTGTAESRGGAIYFHACSQATDHFVTNSKFINNTVGLNVMNNSGVGGAISVYTCHAKLIMTNCTLSGNSASAGGAVHLEDADKMDPGFVSEITNSILWNNSAATGPEIHAVTASVDPLVSYSTVTGATTWPGTANLNTNPLFDSNYRLQCGSPCINSGSDSAVPSDLHDVDEDNDTSESTPDLDLKLRRLAVVDRGAYEKEYEPCTADTNDDGLISVDDLLAVINQWGLCSANPPPCSADVVPGPCDGQGDGVVDVSDLLAVINSWGFNCITGLIDDVGSLTSVQDCMDMATNEGHTPYSAEWNEVVNKCVDGLCAARIIVCD